MHEFEATELTYMQKVSNMFGIPLEYIQKIRDTGCMNEVAVRNSLIRSEYNAYTDILKRHGCMISMTENGDSLENAMAERVNGILKQEWLHYYTFKNQEEAYEVIDRIIRLYNERRPKMGINMRNPNQIHN